MYKERQINKSFGQTFKFMINQTFLLPRTWRIKIFCMKEIYSSGVNHFSKETNKSFFSWKYNILRVFWATSYKETSSNAM